MISHDLPFSPDAAGETSNAGVTSLMAVPPSPTLAPELQTAVQVPATEQSLSGPGLLRHLCQRLDAQGIPYCQWKGLWSAHRWMNGLGNVDLLIHRAAMAEFRQLMGELGFKLALRSRQQIPGMESYVGHDPEVPRLLHLHVHYRLILGDFWKPMFRIPIENPVLAAAVPGELFRVPIPTQQYLIFVLRVVLRQFGRPLLSLQTRWRAGIQPPLASLGAAADDLELAAFLRQHLPSIDLPLFNRCVRSLHREASALDRAVLPCLLSWKLRAHIRRPCLAALVCAAIEKLLPEELASRLVEQRMRLSGGGTVVALVGGDGAGKSTCARELVNWLGPVVPTMRAHWENPPRSLLTRAIEGMLRLQQAAAARIHRQPSPAGVLTLLRHVCTARDRHLLYLKVHRFAAAGGIAICERYPIRENRLLAGPCIPPLLTGSPARLAVILCKIEASYYQPTVRPDLLCILRIDPELAVRRKPEEPSEYIRTRARVIWETDWSSSEAQVIDAGQPLTHVLRQLKCTIWKAL